MSNDVPTPEEEGREPDMYDTWFGDDDSEEESADEETLDASDSSPDEDEEVSVPEEEDPDSSPKLTADDEGDSVEEEAEEDPYAWASELDPELRKQVESLVNRDRSNAGRAAAEANRAAELQARLDKAQAELEAQKQVPTPSAPSQAAGASANVEDMDDDELREFMEEFPQVAANVNKMMERREAQTREEILKEIRPMQQEAQAAKILQRKQQLREVASDIFNTAETGIDLDTVLQSDRWKEWYSSQTPGYQKYISGAAEVEDAAKVLEDFAEYTNREVYAMYMAQEEQRQADEASQADETAARRESAQRGTTPKSRTAELSDRGHSASYNDYFNEFAGG